jgi:hypothetical protein
MPRTRTAYGAQVLYPIQLVEVTLMHDSMGLHDAPGVLKQRDKVLSESEHLISGLRPLISTENP